MTKAQKKKIRKPGCFGLGNGSDSIVFELNKKDLVIEFLGGPDEPDKLWFDAQAARWLAARLMTAADYLDQENNAHD